MKTVQQIMQETGAKANIRNFRYMQENYTYKQKVRHAENVARSYQDKCSEMGLNCHVSVGGLDSIWRDCPRQRRNPAHHPCAAHRLYDVRFRHPAGTAPKPV